MTASRARQVVAVGVVLWVLTGCGTDPATEPTTTTAVSTTSSSPASSTTTSAPPASTTTSVMEQVGDLLVVGDWGSGTMPQGAVAGAMMRYAEGADVEAILTTGDNFYSDDWEFLMDPFGWADEAGIPFWVTWGNHDVEDKERIEAVNTAFDNPPRWAVRQWGAVDVVILDSTQVDSDEQLAFFEEALASSERPTIVVTHHPPYSCGSNGDDDEVTEEWLPRFDGDVVLMLSGHEHVYQRFEDEGITYTVTGGGGATPTRLETCPVDHPERVAGESINHFLVMAQEGNALTVSALDVNGQVFDEFTIQLG